MEVENQQQGEEQQVEKQFLGRLEIMQTVKNSQSQNGLKHGDFLRYRKYCTKKIKKIRKGMKFFYGKGKKFQHKNITEDHPNDPKMLHVLLYEIEHDWAYAMDLRQVMGAQQGDQGNRIKFHVAKKILKAYKKAQQLNEICQERTEETTQKESEAYTCFMGGFYYHEKERWDEALQNYVKSRSIYSELVQISDSLQNAIFKEKIEQLDQSIRYAYYQNGGSMLDSLETILQKLQGQNVQIEKKEQQKSSNQLVEIQYHGQNYPIKNKKVLSLYQNTLMVQQKLEELLKQNDTENTLNSYLELFSNYDDIIKYITADKEDEKNSEAERAIYQGILNYYNSQKFEYLIERNSLLIQKAVNKFEEEKGFENLKELLSKKSFKLKLTRPSEIVKLCDNYLQVIKQLLELERQNSNLDKFRELSGKEIFYKGVRCFYVSLVYYSNDKIIETLSLLSQAEQYFEYVENQLGDNQEYQEKLRYFQGKTDAIKIKVKVSYLESKYCDQDEKLKVNKSKDNTNNQNITIEKLIQEGKESNIDIQKIGQTTITNIPPKPYISGCKPIFFDMAHNNLEYPDISSKTEEKKKGGFFGWFKK